MYFTIEQAREALWERRRSLVLRRKVQQYLGELPEFLKNGPRAVLARPLASPTLECHHFVAGAKLVGLPPAFLEYPEDKFCSCNPDKLALGKMTFHHGKGRNGGEKTSVRRVVDLTRWDGTPFDQAMTCWGEHLLALHHRLLNALFPEVEISDNSCWLQRMGGNPAHFWPRLLSLFVCDGVLFENIHTEGHELEFTQSIIQPALAEVEDRFGLPPVIIPVVPVDRERDRYWSWYPGAMEAQVKRAEREYGQKTGHQYRQVIPSEGGGYV